MRGTVSVALSIMLTATSQLGICGRNKTHTVRPGDSIARIADYYGVSQNDLRDLNHLKRGRPLSVGAELVIPDELRRGAARSHLIRKGDTLAAVAKKHKVSPKELAHANKLSLGGKLTVGRTLVIPDDDDGLLRRLRSPGYVE